MMRTTGVLEWKRPKTLEEIGERLEHGYTKWERLLHDYEQHVKLYYWQDIAKNSQPTPWQQSYELAMTFKFLYRMRKEEEQR